MLVVASCFSISFKSTTSWLANDFIHRAVILLLSLAREEGLRTIRGLFVKKGLEVISKGGLSYTIASSYS